MIIARSFISRRGRVTPHTSREFSLRVYARPHSPQLGDFDRGLLQIFSNAFMRDFIVFFFNDKGFFVLLKITFYVGLENPLPFSDSPSSSLTLIVTLHSVFRLKYIIIQVGTANLKDTKELVRSQLVV